MAAEPTERPAADRSAAARWARFGGAGAYGDGFHPQNGTGAALDLAVSHRADGVHVSLTGELDLATSALVDALLHDLLRARRLPRVARLAFDLSGVTFADAAGLSPLLYARAVLARRQGSVEIVAASPAVRRLLVLLDLTILLAP